MPPSEPGGPARTAVAFAPGHLTGFFVPVLSARDPRGRGSIGGGVVVDAGTTARAAFRPARRRSVEVRSPSAGDLPISRDVADRLLGDRLGRLVVDLEIDLPIGQGLGSSASGAVATALSVASVLGLDRPRAIEVAHLADLFGGGGLGGVSAILGGGLEERQRPGVPPFGRVRHLPFARPILLAVVGRGRSTRRALATPRSRDRYVEAGRDAIREFDRRPSADRFLSVAERFTDRVDLGPERVRDAIGRLRDAGAWAGQTMIGGAVWAVPRSVAKNLRLLRELRRFRRGAFVLHSADRGAYAEPARPMEHF